MAESNDEYYKANENYVTLFSSGNTQVVNSWVAKQ